MKVLLIQDVDNVGLAGDIKEVADGFGRNYLIPQGLALIANASNIKRLEDLRRQEDTRQAKMIGHYQEIADKLKGVTLKIGAKAGTSGKIFGSVTNIQIAAALKEQFGVEVERKQIELPEEVKNIGAYKAVLNMHKDVDCVVDFEVVEE